MPDLATYGNEWAGALQGRRVPVRNATATAVGSTNLIVPGRP